MRHAECHEILKKFMREMLFFELENFEEARPRYAKYYDTAIEKYAKEYAEVKKGAV